MTLPTAATFAPPPLFLLRDPEPPHVAAEAMPLFTEAAKAHLAGGGTRAGLERWLPTAETLVEAHSKAELQEMARAAQVSACGSKAEIAGRLVIA